MTLGDRCALNHPCITAVWVCLICSLWCTHHNAPYSVKFSLWYTSFSIFFICCIDNYKNNVNLLLIQQESIFFHLVWKITPNYFSLCHMSSIYFMIKKLSVTSFDIFCTFLLELGCFSVTFLIHFQFPEQEGYSLSKVFSMKHNNIRQSPHKIHIRSYFMFAYALDLDRFLSDVFFATADQTSKGINYAFLPILTI